MLYSHKRKARELEGRIMESLVSFRCEEKWESERRIMESLMGHSHEGKGRALKGRTMKSLVSYRGKRREMGIRM